MFYILLLASIIMDETSNWTRFNEALDDETLYTQFPWSGTWCSWNVDTVKLSDPFLPCVRFLCSPVKGRTQSTVTLMLGLTQNNLNTSFAISTSLQRSSNRTTIQRFSMWAETFLRAQDCLRARHQNVTNHLLIQYRNVWPAQRLLFELWLP